MKPSTLTRACAVACFLLLASTAGLADESGDAVSSADDDYDISGLTDWYEDDDADTDGATDDADTGKQDYDDDYDYDYDEGDYDFAWEDYDDSWSWDDESFVELDNATDIEYFDDISAADMCALSSDNSSLADALDADTYADFCADTDFADLVDSSMFEVYKEQNGTGFFAQESNTTYCEDMPELDGCTNVAPGTNATAINVIKAFINDAKAALKKNETMAKVFGGVQGRSLVKNVTNATLIDQVTGLTGDVYHLWAVRVTNPEEFFIHQRFGAKFVSGYIKGNPGYFLVHAKVSKIAELKDNTFPFLVDALPMPYQLRVEPFNAASCKLNSTNCHVLDVSILGVTSFDQATQISKTFKTKLAAAGHTVTARVTNSKLITIKAVKNNAFDVKKISAWLARQPKVERIAVGSQFTAGGRPGNILHYSGTDVSTAAKTPLYNLWADGTLAGQGQVVMLGDSGLRAEHCWYAEAGKTAPFNTFDQTRRKLVAYGHNANSDRKPDEGGKADHGTHCAGLIAGQEASVTSLATQTTAHTGTAWKAKLAFYDIGKNGALSGIPDLYSVYLPWVKKAGAYISSNSWGSNFDGIGYSHNGFSGYQSKSIDEWAYENDDVLVLVANGNDGAYGLFTSGAPANCKNCLSVGSADKDGNLGDYSSRGPTADGRIKPDIIGVGTKAISSDSRAAAGGGYCVTVEMTGTSMATPAVAGTLAVLRQYLTEGYYPTGEAVAGNKIANPSAALMKAMLINGAEPVYNLKTTSGDMIPLGTVPSNYQGWGIARMDKTLAVKGSSFFPTQLWDRQTVKNGEIKRMNLNFEPGAAGKELCVTLVWWDTMSWFPQKKAIINDLDLTLVVAGKVVYYPNGLGGPDRLNTVERICIRTTGGRKEDYEVYVTGAKVTTGTQKFSLVVSSRSVKDRKKPQCRTDVCNDFDITDYGDTVQKTIDKVTKSYWSDYKHPSGFKYQEGCEYTKKAECAAKKACKWCTVGSAGRCHRKTIATSSMCPGKNPVTPSTPTPSPPSSSSGATSNNTMCATTAKTNNCAGCAAMSGCNWCTFGTDNRMGCLRDSEKGSYSCTSSASQCTPSPITPGLQIGLSPVDAIQLITASPPPPSPPPPRPPPALVTSSSAPVRLRGSFAVLAAFAVIWLVALQ